LLKLVVILPFKIDHHHHHLPPRPDRFVRQMAQRPAIRPLVLLLKYFLYSRGLHDTYTGGIGSFALQLMVLSYLQLHPSRNDRFWQQSESTFSLGAMFLSFLSYFGKEFNYCKVGISVRDHGSLFLKTKTLRFDSNRPFLLALENPLDPTLDVGRNSYNIIKVRKAFDVAHGTLLAAMMLPPDTLSPSLLSRVLPVMDMVYKMRASPHASTPVPRSMSYSSSSSSSSSDAKKSQATCVVLDEDIEVLHQAPLSSRPPPSSSSLAAKGSAQTTSSGQQHARTFETVLDGNKKRKGTQALEVIDLLSDEEQVSAASKKSKHRA
jgi:hypothetical protein